MVGLGALANTALIVAGGLAGLAGGRLITPRIRDTLMKATALCVMFVGVGGALEQMLSVSGGHLVSGGTAMMIVSMAAGALIGEVLDLDGRFEGFGIWLKRASRNEGDGSFVEAFVTASLTVSIGAMAIVGSIQDGVSGDPSTLLLKGVLDCIIVCVMTASMGRGCIFSAVPVLVFEGVLTAASRLLAPIMTGSALSNLSFVGSMLIFCVGVNLIWPKTFRPANMLPSVVIAVVWALVAGA